MADGGVVDKKRGDLAVDDEMMSTPSGSARNVEQPDGKNESTKTE